MPQLNIRSITITNCLESFLFKSSCYKEIHDITGNETTLASENFLPSGVFLSRNVSRLKQQRRALYLASQTARFYSELPFSVLYHPDRNKHICFLSSFPFRLASLLFTILVSSLFRARAQLHVHVVLQLKLFVSQILFLLFDHVPLFWNTLFRFPFIPAAPGSIAGARCLLFHCFPFSHFLLGETYVCTYVSHFDTSSRYVAEVSNME